MRYRKKPVEIEAIQFEGDNVEQCQNFCPIATVGKDYDDQAPYLSIPTLEGTMKCKVTDYLIKDIAGEYYPCRRDIFEKTYEPV